MDVCACEWGLIKNKSLPPQSVFNVFTAWYVILYRQDSSPQHSSHAWWPSQLTFKCLVGIPACFLKYGWMTGSIYRCFCHEWFWDDGAMTVLGSLLRTLGRNHKTDLYINLFNHIILNVKCNVSGRSSCYHIPGVSTRILMLPLATVRLNSCSKNYSLFNYQYHVLVLISFSFSTNSYISHFIITHSVICVYSSSAEACEILHFAVFIV